MHLRKGEELKQCSAFVLKRADRGSDSAPPTPSLGTTLRLSASPALALPLGASGLHLIDCVHPSEMRPKVIASSLYALSAYEGHKTLLPDSQYDDVCTTKV